VVGGGWRFGVSVLVECAYLNSHSEWLLKLLGTKCYGCELLKIHQLPQIECSFHKSNNKATKWDQEEEVGKKMCECNEVEDPKTAPQEVAGKSRYTCADIDSWRRKMRIRFNFANNSANR